MARQSKEDLQQALVSSIKKAEKVREDWAHKMRVDMAIAYYEGKQNPGYPPAEWITINKIYSHLQAQLPALYSVDPYFYVRVRRSFSPDPAEIARFEAMGRTRSAMLNYLKDELQLKTVARLAIQDAHFSYGVVKVHFLADELENPDKGSAITDDDGKELMGDDGQPLVEPDYLLANERYAITRVDPDDFLWDMDAGPLPDKWSWVAERVKMTKAQARNDKRLKNSVLRDLPTEKDEDKDDGAEVYEFYELYDLKAKTWCIIHEDAKKPVMDPRPLPQGVDGHPYAILRFTLMPKTAYPIPPVSQAIDPQKEYGLARSRLMTHRKRFNRKYQMYGPAFDDPDMAASMLENGGDGTVLISNMPGRAIEPISDASLDQASYVEVQQLNADLVELMGSSDEARGISGADSATQAALIDKNMGVREGDRQSLVIDFVREIARKLDQLVQANITRDEAVRIVGPSGDEMWALVRASDYAEIQGEYTYETNVGATQPRIPQVERAQWLAFLQVIASAPQLMTSKRLLKRMAEMHHIEDDAMVDEIFAIGQQMMQANAAPKGAGSVAGVSQNDPIRAVLGAALGQLGGNANGGGAASLGQA